MLSNIKDYQSETASQHSPSQNSPSCCTHVVYLELLLILNSRCHVCLYSHKIVLLSRWF